MTLSDLEGLKRIAITSDRNQFAGNVQRSARDSSTDVVYSQLFSLANDIKATQFQ